MAMALTHLPLSLFKAAYLNLELCSFHKYKKIEDINWMKK